MDTERKVSQLDSDVHEIYELLRKLEESVDVLRKSSNEQWGMLRRQGNRLDSLEANVAQIQEDVAELKGSVAQILALLQPGG